MWCTPWLWSFLISARPRVWTCTRSVASVPHGTSSIARLHDERGAQLLADRVRERRRRRRRRAPARRPRAAAAPAWARRPRPDEDVAADPRRERADDLADRRREDVDAAHDEHVVGAADAADPRAVAAARAGARPDADVVARAEAQQRRGAVAQVREHELALGAVLQRDRGAGLRVDQLGVDEAARAEVHPVLRLALAPERDADVADPHRLGDARAPALLEPRAERRLAAAGLARDEHAPHGGGGEVDAALGRPLDAGTPRRTASSPPPRARAARSPGRSRSVLPVPTGMWQRPMRSKAASAAPATNGPGVVGRDDPLARPRRPTSRSCARSP